MLELRVERFSNPSDLQIVAAGGEPSGAGWEVVWPGDVYHDGERVGALESWRIERFGQGSFAELRYVPPGAE